MAVSQGRVAVTVREEGEREGYGAVAPNTWQGGACRAAQRARGRLHVGTRPRSADHPTAPQGASTSARRGAAIAAALAAKHGAQQHADRVVGMPLACAKLCCVEGGLDAKVREKNAQVRGPDALFHSLPRAATGRARARAHELVARPTFAPRATMSTSGPARHCAPACAGCWHGGAQLRPPPCSPWPPWQCLGTPPFARCLARLAPSERTQCRNSSAAFAYAEATREASRRGGRW